MITERTVHRFIKLAMGSSLMPFPFNDIVIQNTRLVRAAGAGLRLELVIHVDVRLQ